MNSGNDLMNEGYQQGKEEIKKSRKLLFCALMEFVVAATLFYLERKRKGESDKGLRNRPRNPKVKNLESRC